MSQGFWRGVGGGGDPFWLHREALNFKDPAAYQNTAVFQTGVNTKFFQTLTHSATPLMFPITAIKDSMILFAYYSFTYPAYFLYGSNVHFI